MHWPLGFVLVENLELFPFFRFCSALGPCRVCFGDVHQVDECNVRLLLLITL